MSKLNMVRRCYNCGAILQDTEPENPGYVPKDVFESENASGVFFCEACWKEAQYSISPKEPEVSEDFIDMLRDAQATDAMIVYVIDLFSFENTFSSKIAEMIDGLPLLVVANKRDLLPKKASDQALKDYVARTFRSAKMNVRSENVALVSLTTDTDVSSLIDKCRDMRKKHDVYIIGATGSGKTMGLTAFLRAYNNDTKRQITTAMYPGTKIRVMQVPLDSSSYLYDTPGTSIENSIQTHLTMDGVRSVMPTERIDAKKIIVSKGESLFVGGLARFDLLKGHNTAVSAYFAKPVSVKKFKGDIDGAFLKALEKKSVSPIAFTTQSLMDYDVFDIDVSETSQRDIGVLGLGWISFKGAKQTWRVYVPKGVSIYVLGAKIK